MSAAQRQSLVAVVLAGGLARRMGGGDKCLIPIGGKAMLEHAIERLLSQVGTVLINANGDPGRFAAFEKTVVPDTIEGFAGPLAGVLAALLWARENRPEASHVISAAGDTPFFPRDLADRLTQAAGDGASTIALAETGGSLHPVFGLWPIAIAEALDDWLRNAENRKVLAFVDCFPWVRVAFDDSPGPGGLDPFFNANSPEDLERAEWALREGAG